MLRRLGPYVVLTLLLLPGSSPLLAQGEFPLKSAEPHSRYDALLSRSRQHYSRLVPKPSDLKGLPAGVSDKALYYSIRLGGKEVLLAHHVSRPPKLFVDTDGDRDFSDEQAVEAKAGTRSTGGVIQFAPVTFKAGPSGEFEVKFRADAQAPPRHLLVRPAGLRVGTVTLGEKSYRIAISDGNLDGRYDGMFAPKSHYDWLGIDRNGDGTLDSDWMRSEEIIPLPRLLNAGDAYYSVKVAADGSSVALQKADPRLGVLDVECPSAMLTLLGPCGRRQLQVGSGKRQLPAGKYSARIVTLGQRDDKARLWEVTSYGDTGKLSDFEIREGATLSLKAGPPLQIKPQVSQDARRVRIGLLVLGRAGERYSAAARTDGKVVPAPKLRILDESGKVLDSGRFEYG
ncbi:MAG: hypothetical protein ACYS8L_02805 [Planctomycetota bacterium]|jgi:hypothetical protein